MGPVRAVLAVAGAVLALGAGGAAAAAPPAPAPQELAVLAGTHEVFRGPSAASGRIASVGGRRPITLVATTLPVLAHATDAAGGRWLRVLLPGRRLGGRTPPATGWVAAERTRPVATAWHLLVDVAGRRVTAYRDGVPVRSFQAVVGARATPTPRGRFFVEENVRLPSARVGAPFALALSARSAVLQEFDGGPGQIAVHGRRNIGGRLGTAVSHGCVRLDDRAIGWLAARLRPGVPVTVR